MAKLLKYMGKSDIRTIKKGDNFGGQLRDGVEADLTFNRENNWVLDVEALGLSEETLTLLLAEQEKGSAAFKDVTDMKLVPLNAHQKTFLPTAAKPVPNELVSDDDSNGGGDEYDGLSRARLREIATERGVTVADDASKADLLAALRA